MEHITLPNLFFQKAMEKPTEPFLWAKVEGTWESLSWSETEKKQFFLYLDFHGHSVKKNIF